MYNNLLNPGYQFNPDGSIGLNTSQSIISGMPSMPDVPQNSVPSLLQNPNPGIPSLVASDTPNYGVSSSSAPDSTQSNPLHDTLNALTGVRNLVMGAPPVKADGTPLTYGDVANLQSQGYKTLSDFFTNNQAPTAPSGLMRPGQGLLVGGVGALLQHLAGPWSNVGVPFAQGVQQGYAQLANNRYANAMQGYNNALSQAQQQAQGYLTQAGTYNNALNQYNQTAKSIAPAMVNQFSSIYDEFTPDDTSQTDLQNLKNQQSTIDKTIGMLQNPNTPQLGRYQAAVWLSKQKGSPLYGATPEQLQYWADPNNADKNAASLEEFRKASGDAITALVQPKTNALAAQAAQANANANYKNIAAGIMKQWQPLLNQGKVNQLNASTAWMITHNNMYGISDVIRGLNGQSASAAGQVAQAQMIADAANKAAQASPNNQDLANQAATANKNLAAAQASYESVNATKNQYQNWLTQRAQHPNEMSMASQAIDAINTQFANDPVNRQAKINTVINRYKKITGYDYPLVDMSVLQGAAQSTGKPQLNLKDLLGSGSTAGAILGNALGGDNSDNSDDGSDN